MKTCLCVLTIALCVAHGAAAQQPDPGPDLEHRQPLELVFADSIVPQDRHETMLTTGAWRFKQGAVHDARLTQKIEWGISDRLQISAFTNALRNSNSSGSEATGMGDVELGTRYTWPNAGSPFSHAALALDAAFPSGNPLTGMGDGAYTLSPSVLFSHEFMRGRYQIFSTTGLEFVLARRHLGPEDEIPHHQVFANSGLSFHVGRGWAVTELSARTNRLSGGNDTQLSLTPSYIWRLASRTELLVGIPLGLTSTTNHIGGLVKFTFELGGEESR